MPFTNAKGCTWKTVELTSLPTTKTLNQALGTKLSKFMWFYTCRKGNFFPMRLDIWIAGYFTKTHASNLRHFLAEDLPMRSSGHIYIFCCEFSFYSNKDSRYDYMTAVASTFLDINIPYFSKRNADGKETDWTSPLHFYGLYWKIGN